MNAAIEDFHGFYYDQGHLRGGTWKETYWLGVPVQKNPFDLWIYQEILVELRPDLIVECGTYRGGSALFLASMCDLLDHGRVVTIDVRRWEPLPKHRRIEYLLGSSVEDDVLALVSEAAAGCEQVIVILDSDHRKEHVSEELKHYASFVTPGSYLIVEDTNINGNPVYADFGPGPMEATREFLSRHPEFAADAGREKLLFTFNPGGFLRRVGP